MLKAVKEGTVDELSSKRFRKGEIKATDYPRLLREFVYREENLRAVPGLQTVSVGRNVPRVPRRILNRSKLLVIKEFKTVYPHCPFKKYASIFGLCMILPCLGLSSSERCHRNVRRHLPGTNQGTVVLYVQT